MILFSAEAILLAQAILTQGFWLKGCLRARRVEVWFLSGSGGSSVQDTDH